MRKSTFEYSDEIQSDPIARLMPEKVAEKLRYRAAELCIDQLLNDEDPKTRVDDAEAYRLRGRAREGLIPTGKRLKAKKDDNGRTVLDAAGRPVMEEVELLQGGHRRLQGGPQARPAGQDRRDASRLAVPDSGEEPGRGQAGDPAP